MSAYSDKMIYRLALEDISYFLKTAMESTNLKERGKLLDRAGAALVALHTHEQHVAATAEGVIKVIRGKRGKKSSDDTK